MNVPVEICWMDCQTEQVPVPVPDVVTCKCTPSYGYAYGKNEYSIGNNGKCGKDEVQTCTDVPQPDR